MSKESRHAARLARESRLRGTTARQSGAGSTGAGAPPGSTDSGAPTAGSTGATPGSTGSATGPRGGVARGGRPTSGAGARAGRRDRVRPGPQPTFLERYRNVIVAVAAVVIVAVAVGYVFIGSTSAAYTCGSQFNPSPTPSLSPGSSAQLGFLQDDMGNSHNVQPPQKYLYCPPASGTHYNLPGTLGPIPPRVYGPNDKMGPSNWIHNLEHGGMVILYRNDSSGATSDGQAAFKAYIAGFPASPICKVPAGVLSPVIAQFNDMPHAFAALVWDRVMYFDTWDPDLATRFYLTEAERVDSTGALITPPEKQCTPASSASPAASGVVFQSAVPSAAASAAPSVAPSASPEPSAAPS